ncbi:hypothetical protein B9P52_04695 [Achromobacter denitrificans]|uniref:hypothetical protein n=1 Tax=Achromobacter denitrificans TaxID=32002 RepID=UPI000B4CAAEF|nr:hypothetical protein [Achromobacter denitrificans]ASC63632.1 hypothetical protein B9P52_04695 [Achromobacter denitrificans]
MRDIKFRCSSIGKLMANPTAAAIKAGEVLSVGAKTYIRELAQQEILGIDFEFSSKETQKGLEVEDQSIALLNRVRGLSLVKNAERRTNEWLTGECDLYDAVRRRGHDLKSSWSAKTFPGWLVDAIDSGYEWQMRGYMMLWDADQWEVNYALVDTPERLIGFEPIQMHLVSHIPEHQRLTSWIIERDFEKEREMIAKVKAAREYFAEVIQDFDQVHPQLFKEAA